MKHTKKVTKTITTTEVIKTTCDKCKCEIKENTGVFEINEFELEHNKGNAYPEGFGDGVKRYVQDLCDECIEVLFKLLEENGFFVQAEKYTY